MTIDADQSIRTTFPEPHDWAAKRAEYVRRANVIKGGDYSDAEHQRLGLFKLKDGGGTYHRTRRISTRLAFMVQVDAASIANGCALNVRPDVFPSTYGADGKVTPHPGAAKVQADGQAVWRRSGVAKNLHRWATAQATKGDLHLESSLRVMPDKTKKGVIIAHKAEHIACLRYDGQGIDLAYARIEFEDVIAGYGDRPVKYVRELTPEKIETTIDGKRSEDLSGPNPTGVVTLTHIPHRPGDDPTFSACAFTGFEDGVAVEDSSDMTVQVIGARNAAPILALMGGIQLPPAAADGETPPTASTARSVFEVPLGGDVKLIEAALSGVSALVENAGRIATEAKATAPQYLFVDAGAASSGLALSNRATQYVSYIDPIRENNFQGLARATGIALCMERNQVFDDAADVYEVKGGAALPLDKGALVTLLLSLLEAGGITRADFIAALQGMGVGVPEEAEPGDYAARALADKDAADNALVSGAERIATAADRVRGIKDMPDANMEEVDDTAAA